MAVMWLALLASSAFAQRMSLVEVHPILSPNEAIIVATIHIPTSVSRAHLLAARDLLLEQSFPLLRSATQSPALAILRPREKRIAAVTAEIMIDAPTPPGLKYGPYINIRHAIENGLDAIADRSKRMGKSLGYLRLRLARENRYAVIEVDDDGEGIPRALSTLLLVEKEKGVTTKTKNTDRIGGEGIGLSYSDGHFLAKTGGKFEIETRHWRDGPWTLETLAPRGTIVHDRGRSEIGTTVRWSIQAPP